MTLLTRLALPWCVLAVWGVPGWAQTTGSIMVGTSPPARDVALDRGFVIAKGTTLPRGHGYVSALAPTLTIGAAYAHHLDQETGSIEVGNLADLVVLDRDVFGPGAGPLGADVP